MNDMIFILVLSLWNFANATIADEVEDLPHNVRFSVAFFILHTKIASPAGFRRGDWYA